MNEGMWGGQSHIDVSTEQGIQNVTQVFRFPMWCNFVCLLCASCISVGAVGCGL